MPVPALLLLASPDDFLLEVERRDAEAAWGAQHPDGETTTFDEAPPAAALLRELTSPSLFASSRLVVVRDASAYLKLGSAGADGIALAKSLGELSFSGVALIMAAVSASEPGGAVPDAVRERGELRFLPLPPTPKPWEDVRLTPPQRKVLEGVVRRVAPGLLGQGDALDALFEAYGFRPRELAQAAERLVLAGELTPDAVRAQAGPGECTLKELEDALLHRNRKALAGFFARLSAGATLLGWWGDAVEADRLGRTLTPIISRLLRQALAVRRHAAGAGLDADLDVRRCSSSRWYPTEFKTRIHPRLAADVEATEGSPLAGLSPWNLHRTFRLAAAYGDAELLDALAGLGRSGAEIAKRDPALAALAAVTLALVGPGAPARAGAPAAPRSSRSRTR